MLSLLFAKFNELTTFLFGELTMISHHVQHPRVAPVVTTRNMNTLCKREIMNMATDTNKQMSN